MRFTQQTLLGTLLIDFVVTGGHRFLHFEGFVQLLVVFNLHADQFRVGRPHHRAIQRIDRCQQNVRQMLHMIEKLDARRSTGRWIDIGVSVFIPRVEHLAHGPGRRDLGMTNFGLANGLNKLRGQHRIALDTLFNHKTRGNVAQPQRHRGDDEEARQGEPAHQIERRTPILAFCCRCTRRRFFLFVQCLHGTVLVAGLQAFSAVFRISVGGIDRNA
ncbi:hypothetical protein D3C86_1433610 [compost metagenome]